MESKDIPDWNEKILFEEARGVYGESVCSKVVENSIQAYNHRGFKLKPQFNTDTRNPNIESSLSNSPWDQVRKALRKTCGLDADNTWFKKLQIMDSEISPKESNEQAIRQKTIRIAAPTSFVRDWVNTNYLPVIERELKTIYPEFKYIELVC